MRRYHDLLEVKRGLVSGPGGPQEGPAQLIWRDRLWVVRTVLARWVETGPWWHSETVSALLGADEGDQDSPRSRTTSAVGVLTEREHWRLEASSAVRTAGRAEHRIGVLEVAYDGADGRWWLTCCHD